jgi:hypothetical protein
MTAGMKIVFCDVAPRSLVEINWRSNVFTASIIRTHLPDDEGSRYA